MRDEIRRKCENLIDNRDSMKEVFSWESGMIWLAAAAIYTAKDQTVESDKLKFCKGLIKEQTGIFSNFRGNVRCAVAAMLAISENPEQMLADGLEVHKMLKNGMRDSAYLPLAAMTIARLAERKDYEEVVEKTKEIYDEIKKNHPFLTSNEDSAFCAMMALSEKSAEELVSEAERCYRFLNENARYPKNAVQSLSHVLAICDGTPEEKCEKTIELYETLQAYGMKYGKDYELPTLGVLAMEHEDYEALAEEMKEVDTWLSKQKGFGVFGSISIKQRLMYAGMLLQNKKEQGVLSESAALQSTLAILVAQEAAMMAMLAASTAATVNAANNS